MMLRDMGVSHKNSARDIAKWLKGVSCVALLASSSAVVAQTSDDEGGADDALIVVTAQRRAELSRDVPITVTTMSEAQLKQANVQSLVDVPKLSPGVRFDKQGAYTQPVIRGIGNTIATTGAGNSVGIYVDGFYLPNTMAIDFDFLNVESVQVLKGPQGTLFGRNSTAGAILVTTAEPEFETRGIVEASYERFNAKKVRGYFTTPISDRVAMSAEGMYSEGDGFWRSVYDGRPGLFGSGFDPGVPQKKPGAYESWSTRLSLKADLSDRASLLLRYEHADKHDPAGQMNATYLGTIGGVQYPFTAGDAIPGTTFGFGRREIASNQLADFRIRSNVLQLTGKFDLGPVELTSYTQYRKEKVAQKQDSDFSSASIFALSLPEPSEVVTQEFLLNSQTDSRLQYTAGLFYFSVKYDTGVLFVRPGPTILDFSQNGSKQRTYAAYADLTYEVLDNLFVTGGVRYSRDEVRDPYEQLPFQPGNLFFAPDFDDDTITPRIVVRYKPSEQASIYASYASGYKSAFADTGQTTGDTYRGGFYLRPEEMDAYEVGFKYATGSMSFEAAGFWYDYKNLQNSYYELGSTIYSNAAKSRIKGVEASLSYEVTPGLTVTAAGTYLDAKYRDYQRAGFFTPVLIPDNDGDGRMEFAGFSTTQQFDASGLQVQRAPKFSGTFSANYRTEVGGGELSLSGNLYHSSTVFFDPAHQFPQGAYDIASARVEWTDPSERYTIAIYGDNLLDEKYLTQTYGTLTGAGNVWGEPLTYGISVRYNFGS